jgi:hypothetical protein
MVGLIDNEKFPRHLAGRALNSGGKNAMDCSDEPFLLLVSAFRRKLNRRRSARIAPGF